MSEPVSGCHWCETDGRQACHFHREPLLVSAGGFVYNGAEIERLRARVAELERENADQHKLLVAAQVVNEAAERRADELVAEVNLANEQIARLEAALDRRAEGTT